MSRPGPHRLASGGRVDRSRRLRFTFDGRALHGHPGDTLASALLANGVRLVGRSLKYHRPRGVVSAGAEEPNALVQLAGRDDEPNARATTLALADGLEARSLNRWPSLRRDLGAINDRLSPLLPAGFYYKTFIAGPGWNAWGPLVRRLAGLGRAPHREAPGWRYEKRHHHCDLLVVGAGPAGLVAARTAARAGLRVVLADERAEPGGALLDAPARVGGAPGEAWAAEIAAELDAIPRVVRLARTTALGYYDHDYLTLLEAAPPGGGPWERLWKVRARRVVLATGATERPLVFADNDRPGVVLAHAALAYVRRYGVSVGRRAVVFTNNSSAYTAAFELAAAGLEVAAVADARARVPEPLHAAARERGIEVLAGHVVTGVEGRHAVRAVTVAPRAAPRRGRRIACDAVLVSGGWNPAVHLASQSGARPVYDPALAAFVPGAPVQAERSAGAARGVLDLPACLADGARAGAEALAALGVRAPAGALATPEAAPTPPLDLEPLWAVPGPARGKAFVDFQNDVTAADVELAVREGFESVEHVKRYTTAGMGTDQGKLGNANVVGLLASLLGRDPGEVGTTTYRPPYAPVGFGAVAGHERGELVLPSRRTPVTDWNEERGAVLFEAGAGYRRPSHYPRPGEDLHRAVQREARAARTAAAIYDGSPLGKLELQGRDVGAFLERVYTNRFADLAPGRGRFGWMLREDGRLLDDGVTFRLGERRWWLFCGTGAAAAVELHLAHLLQLEWPDLDVHVVAVTAQWANACVCGPRAREVLRAAGTDLDLERAAFPFMALREGEVAGIPARVARVGYTGELSFEVNVPAGRGRELWEALMAAGEPFGLTPIGSEASLVLRCEKGFVSAAHEGDGTVNPYDAGLARLVDESKPDFIGKRSLERDRRAGGVRQEVVGLAPLVRDRVPPDGTPIVEARDAAGRPRVTGYVTQGCYSPNLDRAIALAVLDGGRARLGERVTLEAVTGTLAAEVVRPCFVDPRGERMRG